MNAISPIVRVYRIGTSDVDDYWFYAESLIEKAVRRGNPRVSLEGTYNALKEGRWHLFVAKVDQEIKGAATAFLTDYGDQQWLTINLCGGFDMLAWLDKGIWFLEEFAKANGCVGMETVGRYEWGRVLNMRPRSMIYERIF